jgi:hypothetical protein
MSNRNCGRALSARELVDSDGGEATQCWHRNNSRFAEGEASAAVPGGDSSEAWACCGPSLIFGGE